jgi:hypothetical protein
MDEGGRLPMEAWIANILEVEAAKELNSDLLSPEFSAQANPDTAPGTDKRAGKDLCYFLLARLLSEHLCSGILLRSARRGIAWYVDRSRTR